MKILIANHFPLFGSGSGTYTLNLAREMLALGHEVCVLAVGHGPATGEHPFTMQNMVFSDGTNADADLDFNFPCFTTHPESQTTFYELTDDQVGEYIGAWDRLLAETIERFRPDILHAQHAWVIPYCASKLDIPYVLTVHGTDLMGFRNDERYHDAVLAGVRGAAKVITISRLIDSDTCSLLSVPPEKTVIVHNGFDARIFHPRPVASPLTLGGQTVEVGPGPTVAFVGKLTHFKGVDLLLRAAAIYELRLHDVTTLLAGSGELEKEMKELAAELRLKRTHFVGLISPEEVADLYNGADVAVVPSRVEPFGLVALEALACGTPVIATDEGGLPDFVNEMVGALVPVDDPERLAEAVVREISGKTKQTKGPHAAQYALDRFQWSRVAGQTEAVYADALA